MKIIESTLSKASVMKLNVAPKYFQTNEMGGGFSHGCISGKSNEGAVRPCVAAVVGGGWRVVGVAVQLCIHERNASGRFSLLDKAKAAAGAVCSRQHE